MAKTAFEDKILVEANSPRAFILQFVYCALAQESFILERICECILCRILFLVLLLESFYSFGCQMYLISIS